MTNPSMQSKLRTTRSILITFVTVCIILIVSGIIIAYGRGYRLDIKQQSVKPTGLLAVTSDPSGAEILINGKLTSATNDTINLTPNWYTVRVVKEGYQAWEKKLRVQGEVVTRADIYFFPSTPSLSVISRSGITNPILSPDGTRLAYIIPKNTQTTENNETKTDPAGIWILDLAGRPLTLSRDARRITNSLIIDFSESSLVWSPDGSELMAINPHLITKAPVYYLLDPNRENTSLTQYGSFDLLALRWEEQKNLVTQHRLEFLKKDVLRVATSSAKLLSFSPDESKVLYEATASASISAVITPPLVGINTAEEKRTIEPNNYYIYDIKEDRNYWLGKVTDFIIPNIGTSPTPVYMKTAIKDAGQTDYSSILPPFSAPFVPVLSEYIFTNTLQPLQWLSTSRHLIYVKEHSITMIEFDASIKQTIYSGPFEDGFVVPWAGENRFLILSNFNPEAATLPTLYSVNLR